MKEGLLSSMKGRVVSSPGCRFPDWAASVVVVIIEVCLLVGGFSGSARGLVVGLPGEAWRVKRLLWRAGLIGAGVMALDAAG
jgi:hypothetical protein